MAQVNNSAAQDVLAKPATGFYALRLGNSVTITTGAASAGAALPVDANSKPYAAYMMTATVACWFNFSTSTAGTDAAVAAAAGTYAAVPGDYSLIVVPPPGTVSINAIQEAAAGKLNIVGLL